MIRVIGYRLIKDFGKYYIFATHEDGEEKMIQDKVYDDKLVAEKEIQRLRSLLDRGKSRWQKKHSVSEMRLRELAAKINGDI